MPKSMQEKRRGALERNRKALSGWEESIRRDRARGEEPTERVQTRVTNLTRMVAETEAAIQRGF